MATRQSVNTIFDAMQAFSKICQGLALAILAIVFLTIVSIPMIFVLSAVMCN